MRVGIAAVGRMFRVAPHRAVVDRSEGSDHPLTVNRRAGVGADAQSGPAQWA